MKITFLGAAETVTGSQYLVETKQTKFLIDCGMFQGSSELDARNAEEFGFDPKEIDFLVLTHTHIDHSGLVPKLVRHGFQGKIFLTVPTRHLAEIILLDSAKIQELNIQLEEEADWNIGQAPVEFHFLYDTKDVLNTLQLMHPVNFGEVVSFNQDVKFRLVKAGHILGAASVEVWVNDSGEEKKIAFSGDLGHDTQEVVARKDFIQEADFVVMESLYGGKVHQPRQTMRSQLADAINKTYERGGNILIPVFSVQRTQELLYELGQMKEKTQISEEIPAFLDSPLAIKATRIYKDHKSYLKKEFQERAKNNRDPMDFEKLKMFEDNRKSRKLRKIKGAIIMAGSGMCNGGRMVGHLMRNLPDSRTSVVFVGFQAEETLGREILTGKKEVVIHDKQVRVEAEIHGLLGFSAHGDEEDLVEWITHFNRDRLKNVFLVHAEIDQSSVFQQTLQGRGISSQIPAWKETVEL
jgi:metallo-beta-lactamase family protein